MAAIHKYKHILSGQAMPRDTLREKMKSISRNGKSRLPELTLNK